ncbi:MAG: CobW family GTP-binding protein, partial [Betaproteobacteria bacterium]
MQAEPQVPVTVLTGFLGAGKTTLLNRILKEQHGHRIAVIENEFGPEGIDNEILVEETREQIVEMNNGCICCTVRGDLVRILDELKTKREAGQLSFDRVIIETTGMANPGPVTQTFFMDEGIS